MKNKLWKKGLLLGIIMLFVGASIIPGIMGFDIGIEKTSEETIQESKTIQYKVPQSALLGDKDNIFPVACFTYEQDEEEPLLYHFYDCSTDEDGYIIYWYWNFDDGTILEYDNENIPETIEHKYAFEDAITQKTVSLSVTDNAPIPGYDQVFHTIDIIKTDEAFLMGVISNFEDHTINCSTFNANLVLSFSSGFNVYSGKQMVIFNEYISGFHYIGNNFIIGRYETGIIS